MLAIAAVALLGIAILVPATKAEAFQVRVEHESRVITWNAQGANVGTSSIWSFTVPRLVNGNYAGGQTAGLVNIQEAGPRPPAGAVFTGRHAHINGVTLNEYEWNMGTRTRPNWVYLYFMQFGESNNRLNLATVTTARADHFQVMWPAGGRRPTYGLFFDNTQTAFWNVHILSGGGAATVNEANNYIQAIHDETVRDWGQNWVIMGDWNMAPANMHQAVADVVAPPCNEPTHQGGGVLDYAVLRNVGENRMQYFNRPGIIDSDHYAVAFNFQHVNVAGDTPAQNSTATCGS